MSGRRLSGLALAALAALPACGRMTEIDAAALAAARQRWRSAGVKSYRLVLVIEATDLAAERCEIQVVDGAVREATRDGVAMTGDVRSYTVEGLFDLLERELELAAEPVRSFGAPPGYRAYVFAGFDPERGIPISFRRVVGGTKKWAEWKVVRFEG